MEDENEKDSFSEDKVLKERVAQFFRILESKQKPTVKQEIKQADKWLTWACSNQHLKIIATVVPDDILPKDWSGKLLDCKVFTKNGPDDKIFNENPDIRKNVARGNCFLELRSPSWSVGTTCVVRGITKFTGGMGDDDDRDAGDDFTWKSYFTKPMESVKKIISTSKANGESAHVSAIVVEGTRYWVAGSKNVHMLFRNEDDLKKYEETQQRFTMAREISQTLLVYTREHPDDAIRLHDFLANNKLTGNFEFLNPAHSHVEDLSHLERPELIFITWTPLDLGEVLDRRSDKQLAILAPDLATQVAKSFRLKTVECSTVLPLSLEEHLFEVRFQYHKEGEVLYFLDDGDEVVGMLKKKSVWYIMVRAIREKVKYSLDKFIKQNKNFSFNTEMAKISKRQNEIQKWLKLDEDTVKEWKNLAREFVKWMLTLAENEPSVVGEVPERFPTFWMRFLKETSLSDEIRILHTVA